MAWNAAIASGLTLRRDRPRLPLCEPNADGGMSRAQGLRVRKVSPAAQPFTVSDPIPAGTTFARGKCYDAATNTVSWTGTIGANETRVLEFTVKVAGRTPTGTVITNAATPSDDALGSSASATTVVK